MHTFDLRLDSSGGFDFLIDDRFLREMIFQGEDMDQREITVLRRRKLPFRVVQDQIRRMKGELSGPLFPQRVWLYFCPTCFDEGCGGISVKIQVHADRVVWSDFRHDGLPDNENESEDFEDDDVITAVGTLVFDRGGYDAALDRAAQYLRPGIVTNWVSFLLHNRKAR